MGEKILLPQDIAQCGKDYLLERGYEIKIGDGISEEEIVRNVKDCSAIIARLGNYNRKVLEAGEHLRVIARHGAGFDNIDLCAAQEKEVWVTYDPVSNGNAVAEHTVAMLMGIAGSLAEMDYAVRVGDFEIRNRKKTLEIEGKTLGIIGYGRIGRMVAKKAGEGLGMKILVYDRYLSRGERVKTASSVEEVLERSDFVSLHMPLTDDTRGMIGRQELKAMKPGAVLINTARGELVKEKELIEALRKGIIAGAALDVFEQEPPDIENPLLSMKQVLLSPHNAALTENAMNKMAMTAARAVDSVLSGKIPEYVVLEGKLPTVQIS